MHTKLLFRLFAMLLVTQATLTCYSQNGVINVKGFGGSLNGSFNKIWKLPDGNFMATKHLAFTTTKLVKFDNDFNIYWESFLGPGYSDFFPTADGGYLLVNTVQPEAHNWKDDIGVMKFNSSLQLEWSRFYGGSNNDQGLIGTQAPNGDFLIAGRVTSTNGDVVGKTTSDVDIWLLRLNANGDILNQRIFGGSLDDYYVTMTNYQSGLLMGITTHSSDGTFTGNHGNDDIWLFNLDNSLNTIWSRCIGGTNNEYLSSIALHPGGDIYLGGSSTSGDFGFQTFGGYYDGVVIKLNSQGEQQWTRAIRGENDDGVSSVIILSNGDIVAGGTSGPYQVEEFLRAKDHADLEGFVVRLTTSGEFIWKKSIGGAGFDQVYSVLECSDGSILVSGSYGYSSNNGDFAGVPSEPGEQRAYLMRLRSSMANIKGRIYFDNNNNSVQDAGESLFTDFQTAGVFTEKIDFSGKGSALSGKFLLSVDTGTYYTSILPVPGWGFDTGSLRVTPKRRPSQLTTTSSRDSFDFRIVPLSLVKDIEVTVREIGAVPTMINNTVKYRVVFKNLGPVVVGNSRLALSIDGKIQYLSSTRSPDTITPDSLIWNFPSVGGFFRDSFDLTFKVRNAPLVTVGSIVQLPFRADPFVTDFDSVDNKTIGSFLIQGQNAAISNFTSSFTALDSARIGRQLRYVFTYNYSSNLDSNISRTIRIIKSNKTELTNAIPLPSLISGDTLTWNFTHAPSIIPDTIRLFLRVSDTPAVHAGDFIIHQANVRLNTNDPVDLSLSNVLQQEVSGYYISPDLTNTLLSPPNGIKWTRSFGGTNLDVINDVKTLSDSGFVVAGKTRSSNHDMTTGITLSDQRPFIAKFDSEGHVKWKSVLNNIIAYEFLGLNQTRSGSFLALGASSSLQNISGRNIEALIAKYGKDGNFLWAKSFGGNQNDEFKTAIELPDKGIIAFGNVRDGGGEVYNYYETYSSTRGNAWVVRLDSNGQLLWSRTVADGTAAFFAGGIKLTADNKLILNGSAERPDEFIEKSSAYIAKMDLDGNILWLKKYRYDNHDYAFYSLELLPDSSMMVTGRVGLLNPNRPDSSYKGLHGQVDVWMGKFNKDGVLSWGKFLGGTRSEYAVKLLPTKAGTYVLAGISNSNDGNLSRHYGSTSINDGWILEVDSTGKLLWQRTIGGTQDDFLQAVTELPDGSLIAVGGTSTVEDNDVHNGHGNYDGLIVKIGKANFINGVVYIDKNDNSIRDAGEPGFSNGSVTAEKIGLALSAIPTNGNYVLSIDSGRYKVRFNTVDTAYYTIHPPIDSVNFPGLLQSDTINFRLVKKGEINDLRIDVIPLSTPRPGFDAKFAIKYQNKGTTDINNASIEIITNDVRESITSDPVFTQVAGDTIRWNIGMLPILAEGEIMLTIKLKAPPAVINGDVMLLKGIVFPIVGDSTPVDNVKELAFTIRGSYDPNDKSELHDGQITQAIAEGKEHLTYTIRFQNTGTDTAFNIYIRDTLDKKLDWTTLEMIGASHSYTMQVTEGNKIEWRFQNALLPDSNVNEPASHGYISFRIKARPDVQLSDTIANKASIYFDFNLPVQTNKVQTIVVSDIAATCPGGNVLIVAKYPGTSWQWQVNTGNGYVNISDNVNYSGANNDSLQINAISPSWFGRKYRCVITTPNGIVNGPEYSLKFQVLWNGSVNNAWENPANWSCGVIPDENTDVVISSNTNTPEINSNVVCRSLVLKPGTTITVKSGATLRLTGKK